MAKDDKKTAVDSDEKIAKVLERLGNDPNAVAKAYAELEAKMAEQGQELGTTRKQAEAAQQLQAQLQQYQQWAQQVTPGIQWLQQNQNQLQEYAKWLQARGQPPPSNNYDNSNSLLTQDERNALLEEATKRVQEQALKPFQDQLNQQLQKLADDRTKQVTDSSMAQQRANMDVMWKTLEYLAEQSGQREALDRARTWHEEALKYADPSKIDPMQVARERLDLQSERDRLNAELETLKKQQAEQEERAAGLLSGNTGGALGYSKEDLKPKSRDDIFKASVESVKNAYGADGLAQLGRP